MNLVERVGLTGETIVEFAVVTDQSAYVVMSSYRNPIQKEFAARDVVIQMMDLLNREHPYHELRAPFEQQF